MQRPVIDVFVMFLSNGFTFRQVDHSIPCPVQWWISQNSASCGPHFACKQPSPETGATPAKSECSSRFRVRIDGYILKAGAVFHNPESSKSHAKGDGFSSVCILWPGINRTLERQRWVEAVRILWWELAKSEMEAPQSLLTYSSSRCKDHQNSSMFQGDM